MSAPRTALVAVSAWLAVVAVGSTLVWTVISRTGDVVPAAGGGSAATQTSATSEPTVIHRSHRHHGPTKPSGGAGGRSGTPSTHPATPSTTPSSEPPSSPAGSAPPPPAHTTPAAPPAERRTWQGSGGYVSVECRGPRISLVAAQADAGFRVEVGSRGPAEVEVTFKGQGDEHRETEVHAHCAGGSPVFQVHTAND